MDIKIFRKVSKVELWTSFIGGLIFVGVGTYLFLQGQPWFISGFAIIAGILFMLKKFRAKEFQTDLITEVDKYEIINK